VTDVIVAVDPAGEQVGPRGCHRCGNALAVLKSYGLETALGEKAMERPPGLTRRLVR